MVSKHSLVPVVLSGGSGSRLWPLSREAYPKQLLPLIDETTMLQATLLRLGGLEHGPATIVCNEAHRFLVAEQLRAADLSSDKIILEPVGRNTAPAIAIAALAQQDPDAVMLVLPADHVIQHTEAFLACVEAGAELAVSGHMVTFGIVPTSANTGYGYIQGGDELGIGARKVAAFVEKPDLDTANKYLQAGSYFWNSGMFMFTSARYLEELGKFQPEMLVAARQAYDKAAHDLDFVRLDEAAFAACPADSIDYAVMEKTESAVVIPADIGWNDVGAWSSLWEVSERDSNGNCLRGDVLSHNVTDTFVQGSKRVIALVGTENLVIVDTDDALLVANKDQVQHVKQIVNELKAAGRKEVTSHRKVYRP